MSTRYSPTVRRRRLSAELRQLRHGRHMTLDDAAAATELARSTIGNIESGEKKRPKIVEVRALLDAYKVEDPRRYEQILTLCRQSREKGWWARYKDVLTGDFIGFEAEAAVICNWEPLVVPGLLQTPEYVEFLVRSAVLYPSDVSRAIDARLTRQKILDSDPPELWAVFDETALTRLAGGHPELLRRQVEHLLAMAQEPATTIQMTPGDRPHPGTGGPFVIMDFPEVIDPSVVYLETDTDGLYLEEPEELARYRHLFGHIRIAALTPEETVARLQAMIN